MRGNHKSTDTHRREVIATNIRRFRKEQKITQEELGKYAGVTGKQIQYYEHGSNEPTASVLYNIAERLNVNLYRLYMDDYEWFEYNL